ncbi:MULTISPECIES: hypothetical protein [unclassified Cupriavidus]|nr:MULTISPECIES: hypothetical protein [unclassified Cupriavidus]
MERFLTRFFTDRAFQTKIMIPVSIVLLSIGIVPTILIALFADR